MKKIFTLFAGMTALLLNTPLANAQDNGWWIGGKISYWQDNAESGLTSKQFELIPEAGYNFNSRWALAGIVGYGSSVLEWNGVKETSNVVLLEPYVRYNYFNSKIVSLFIDGRVGFALGDKEGWEFGITPGITLKASEHFGFVSTIGFLGYCKDYFNGGDGEGFGFGLTNGNLKFGVYYAF